MLLKTLDINGFSAFLLTRNLKNSTIRRRVNVLKLLASKIETTDYEEFKNLLLKLKLSGKRHSYINDFIDTYNLYRLYLGLEKIHTPRFKDQSFVKATMSDEEIEAFIGVKCPNGGEKYAKRWNKMKMFWSICAFTGMRTGEAASLKVGDCDFGRGVFVLSDTKTNDPRFVPIPPNIESDLKTYISLIKSDRLFPSPRASGSLDSVDWGYDFHKRITLIGVRRTNLTPYSLRHSLITRLLEEDVNLFKVQKIVGHRRLETTAAYTHLTTKDIKEAIRRHPLIRRATNPRAILTALVEAFTSLFDRDDRFEKSIEDKDDEIIIRVKIRKP